jgi:hypothetical protein
MMSYQIYEVGHHAYGLFLSGYSAYKNNQLRKKALMAAMTVLHHAATQT